MSNNISIPEYTFRPCQWLLGGQMTFVAFGPLVLVPLLTGGPDLLDFSAVAAAPWISVLNFVLPEWNLQASIVILTVATGRRCGVALR
jgi:xanthine/uracil permease